MPRNPHCPTTYQTPTGPSPVARMWRTATPLPPYPALPDYKRQGWPIPDTGRCLHLAILAPVKVGNCQNGAPPPRQGSRRPQWQYLPTTASEASSLLSMASGGATHFHGRYPVRSKDPKNVAVCFYTTQEQGIGPLLACAAAVALLTATRLTRYLPSNVVVCFHTTPTSPSCAAMQAGGGYRQCWQAYGSGGCVSEGSKQFL